MSEGQKPTRPLLWQVEFLTLLVSIEKEYHKTVNTSKRERLLRYHTLIAIGGYIGPRAKEFLNLTWYDVVNKNELDFYQYKVGRKRRAPFHPKLIKMINRNYELIEPINEQHLILHKEDNPNAPVSTRQFNASFKRLLERAGIDTRQPSSHTLRKTFALHVYADIHNSSSKGLAEACKMLDHRSIDQTMDYIGLTEDKLKETFLKF